MYRPSVFAQFPEYFYLDQVLFVSDQCLLEQLFEQLALAACDSGRFCSVCQSISERTFTPSFFISDRAVRPELLCKYRGMQETGVSV